MSNYQAIIKQETEVVAKLHLRIHETFKNRSKDLKSWKKACEEFHAHVSRIDPILNRVYEEAVYSDKKLQEFIITFLELDPMFFRSGYIKEEMLRKIKKSPLSLKQINRLRQVLKDAVKNRGTREFKKYCSLAINIANPELVAYLISVSKQGIGAKKSRAKLMLNYVGKQVVT
ncbi:MAG: hypothetical protein JKY19_13700 [Alcanivoracaceae bacterium]|nr:hypothetical protein [Alcanivoracaceae bacterium]